MKLYDDQIIVITGGCGFIGSGVIRQLNELGKTNIVIIDELGKTEKWKNLRGKRIADVIPKAQCFQWLEGREPLIESIVHLGACTSTVETDASYLLENNYRFSMRLVEYALKNNIRFVYASSAATYGNGEEGFSDNHDTIDKLHPMNMYGMSKQLFDLWLKNQGLLDRVVGLKFFNVFGPNEWHKGRMASALFHMFPIAFQDNSVRLFRSNDSNYSNGEQKRDFIYVKDVARMTCAFLQNSECGIFNIGTGIASSWNQVATALFKALNKTVKIEYIDMPQDLIGKYQNFSQADMVKTRAVLQAQAQCMPLEEAVADYVRNYLIPQKTW